MLLFRFVGLLLLRCADRQLFALLFQLPPRITRFEPVGRHPKSFHDMQSPVPTAARQREGHQCLHPLLQLCFRPAPFQVRSLVPAEFAGETQLASSGQAQFAGMKPAPASGPFAPVARC